MGKRHSCPILLNQGADMVKKLTGNQIRQSFVEFFKERGHTFVASSSLVPGGDATLLFTNAGMVQFKDVFLGTDQRPYTRAVNSQKCMRVAGKHNDLDDVGRDDWHHTFFEMLGNWSFGDYYKEDAIAWAWELLTDVWEIDKSALWVTVFRDEKDEIPTDEEAAQIWRKQPGINKDQIKYFGRKENFWEMADTGPCGPCSEIHIDRGLSFCDLQSNSGHVCAVNGDCKRFLELWNNVFIQYNRIDASHLEPLPATHVDTGMGFERIVSVLQDVNSNYKTDLLAPLVRKVQEITQKTDTEIMENYTPYRVIADHVRAVSFLIADGVVPGNTGRNYVCRMIIRRAARFAGKIGIHDPFMASIADAVIEEYGQAYPELVKHKKQILDNITREEERFQKTLDAGLSYLEEVFATMRENNQTILNGGVVFDLYATHGLPLELSRDIARENGFEVDESGFRTAMDQHRLDSGAGKVFGLFAGDDVEIFRFVFERLRAEKLLSDSGVFYDPYSRDLIQGKVLALFHNGEDVSQVREGDTVEILLPETCFYVESGGQVSDTGTISAKDGASWVIEVTGMRKPAAGIIVHQGRVVLGHPRTGDIAVAAVDANRRKDIMRNHTGTHLLHAALHKVLGDHARQAGSLVAPDRLRFDFTHPEGLSFHEIEEIERIVNQAILASFTLNIKEKSLQEAISDGAMALFGEKYGERVRTITIGDNDRFSYELCGGTHVENTGDIGTFLIVSEGSAAAGIRRIEAITGREAFELIQKRFALLKQLSGQLSSPPDVLLEKVIALQNEIDLERKENAKIRMEIVSESFLHDLVNVNVIKGASVYIKVFPNADGDTLRVMTDIFREKFDTGVIVLASVLNGKPTIIAAVTENLISRGMNAGNLVKHVAGFVGGGGGGKPTLAQAGGKDPEKLPLAMESVTSYIESNLI
jgi:alanyl-tRNA synthetase